MKNARQIVLLLLALSMVLSLTGCGTVPPGSTGSEPTTTGSNEIHMTQNSTPGPSPSYPYPYNNFSDYFIVDAAPDDDVTVTIQHLPEKVENPENFPVLKWVCAASVYEGQVWSEDAAHELNQLLSDRDMPFRIQFVLVKIDNYSWYGSPHWFTLPGVEEALKDADLIFGSMGPDERQKYLMPVTEYVTGDAQPSLRNAVLHELNWISGTVNGEIYGVPAYPNLPACNGWRVKPALLKECGLSAEDFNKNFWEMDDIFAQIYEKNGNNPFLYIDLDDGGVFSSGSANILSAVPYVINFETKYAYQYIGACFGLDLSGDVPTVVNTPETDTFRKMRAAVQRYRAAGYTTVDTNDSSAFESAQMHYASVVGNTVFTDTGTDYVHIPVTTVVINNSYKQTYISGVAADSRHKTEAVALLNLIAEDEAFRTHLFFGKEGRDYKVTDGEIIAVRREDGSQYDMRFVSMLSEYGDLCDEMKTGYPTHEGKTKLQTYLDNMESVEICYLPIIFDYTGFEEELETLGALIGQFYDTYSKLTEDAYDQMLQELKDTVCDDIQAELQRQLDAWLAENPDWK